MRQALRQRFWLPLLLLVLGYHRQRNGIDRRFNGLFFVDAAENCVPNRCIIGCNCVLLLPDNDDNATCAEEHGEWGWIPPDYSTAKVWKKMEREVRPIFVVQTIAVSDNINQKVIFV